MKCYYEELALERNASEDEIKSSYRKLALKWHPDKNPECVETAKERFQLIQQAYEVLSDPQERAWYDNHREQILRGKNSNFEDNCLDLFQYFSVTCFKGFGDDENGFYAVYQEVFKKISAEDAEFFGNEEDLLKIPKFGDSKSSYEEIVGPFYAYWSAYCTKRTYTWLCPYDINQVKDRRILREIEKETKKIAQKAKKERNEEVRNLVSFVRKRDKRVQAFKKVLEERSAFIKEKQERNRIEQKRRRQQEIEQMRKNSPATNRNNDDYEEQLKQLELEYNSDDEFFECDEPEEYENMKADNYNDGLYCVACNKEFKTEKSLANHEISRKHRDNIEKLKIEMQCDESFYLPEENLLEMNEIKSNDLEGNTNYLSNEEDAKATLTKPEEYENMKAGNYNDGLYCVACNKEFKTEKSLANHEISRKHRDNIEKLKIEMQCDESFYLPEENLLEMNEIKSNDLEGNTNYLSNEEDAKATLTKKISKTKVKKEHKIVKQLNELNDGTNIEEIPKEIDDFKTEIDKDNEDWDTKNKKFSKRNRNKDRFSKTQYNLHEQTIQKESEEIFKNKEENYVLKSEATQYACETCKSNFESKNKLFSHLKLTNHAVFVPKAKNTNDERSKSGKIKGKKKNNF